MSNLITWGNGGYTVTVPNNKNGVIATMGKSEGKWYWELVPDTKGILLGVNDGTTYNPNSPIYTLYNILALYGKGSVFGEGYQWEQLGFEPYSSEDVLGVALDLDKGTINWLVNGVMARNPLVSSILKSDMVVYPMVTSSGSRYNATVIANFGATPFKYLTPELKEQGYLPYDIDNAHEDNLPYVPNKYLFRKDNRIYKLTEEGIVELGQTELTKELFEQYGVEDITNIINFNREIKEEGNKIQEGVYEFSRVPQMKGLYNNLVINNKGEDYSDI